MRVASSGASAPRISRRMLAIGIGSLVGGLIVLGSAATVYTDSLWFRELKFGAVFWTQIWTKLGLAAAFGAIFAVLLLLNLWIAQKITSPAHVFTMRDQMIERYRMMLRPYVRRLVVGGVILFGLFAGSSASGQWRNWLLFRNAETFGQTDPVFGKDLGFFVFKLPFHQFLFTWGFSSLLVITLIVAGAHYLMGGIRTEGAPPRVAPHVKAHLSVLLGLVVASKAWAYRLDQFNLLYSPRGGQVTGASYTDVNAQLPALKLLVVIAIVCAILFLVNIRFRGWVLPAAGLGILIITSIIAGGIYPATVQRLRVNPQERDRERPYIERNIVATRAAFGLADDDVAVRSLPAGGVLTPAMLKDNQATVENLRMWDPKVLVKAYTQLQRITPYYEFLDVDVDRYQIGGRPRQVMLSAREMAPSGLPAGARTWVNNHLVYTHGFGMVASRVDQATNEGQPQFIISDIPAKETAGAPKITEPRIYYGESEEQAFVVVRSANEELDFPEGQTSFESSSYQGTGGIQLSGFLRRAAFAWRFRDPNLLISGAIKSESRIMFNRQIASRVRRVAPFVQLDDDPYLTVVNGNLVWVQDAYTTTPNYPYAQRVDLGLLTDGHLTGPANYIRNSIKATVDALNGTVTLYLWDPSDPIARAWDRVFPGLIRPASEMEEELKAHVRYPEDLFRVQADRYATYHITDPIDFYSKNDVWRIPQDPTSTDGSSLPPYYVLMRLPGEDKPEFVLMLPFSPFSGEGSNATRRQNMTSWLAARMDGDQYGNLVSFQYSKETLVFGPEQVATRINNDQNVRNVISALDPREERIRWGNLLVVPIEDAVLYVRPLYLESPESSLPEFKRVVIVTGDRIRISETIEGALAALFGEQPPGEPDAPAGETVADLITEAMEHFRLADQALRAGDFGRFGREQAAGREALAEAARLSGVEPAPTESPSPSPSPSP